MLPLCSPGTWRTPSVEPPSCSSDSTSICSEGSTPKPETDPESAVTHPPTPQLPEPRPAPPSQLLRRSPHLRLPGGQSIAAAQLHRPRSRVLSRRVQHPPTWSQAEEKAERAQADARLHGTAMRSVHSPPPPAAAGEKPPGHGLGPSPPVSERHGPCAAPQRASRRAPRRRRRPQHTKARLGGVRAAQPSARGQTMGKPGGASRRCRRASEAAAAGGGSPVPRSSRPAAARSSPSAGEQPQPPPGSQGSAALLPAVQRGQQHRREGPPVYATATGAAHRLRRAGQGWAGPGEAPPHRPVRRGSAGRGGSRSRWRVCWELRGDAAGRVAVPPEAPAGRARSAPAVTLGALSCLSEVVVCRC